MMDPAVYPGDYDLYDVLDNVMQSFLCIEAAPTLPPEVSNLPGLEQGWVGTVAITGAFNGAVTFQSSRAFARQAAAIVFKGDAIDDDAARDVIAEITNMLGGNIKSGFATADKEACHLSLPFVSISEVAIPKAHLVMRLWAHCESEPVCLSLFQADAAASA